MSTRVAVTGAGGFIGTALVRALVGEGYLVSALDLQARPDSLPSGVDWVRGSVTDPDALDALVASASCVVHLAFRMDLHGDDPLASAQSNLLGTVNVFDAAARHGLSRAVWSSTIMVYGPREKYPLQPLTEAAEPMPRTAYGASKLALEWLARSYRRQGLETVALRLGTVFGPGRLRHGAAEFAVTLFQEPAAGRPVSVVDGDRTANMLYVEDAVAACLCAVQAPGALADVYNINGFECSVAAMALEVTRLLPDAAIEVSPGGHSPWPTAMHGGAARRDLAYEPRFTLDRAVMDYLAALGCSIPPQCAPVRPSSPLDKHRPTGCITWLKSEC